MRAGWLLLGTCVLLGCPVPTTGTIGSSSGSPANPLDCPGCISGGACLESSDATCGVDGAACVACAPGVACNLGRCGFDQGTGTGSSSGSSGSTGGGTTNGGQLTGTLEFPVLQVQAAQGRLQDGGVDATQLEVHLFSSTESIMCNHPAKRPRLVQDGLNLIEFLTSATPAVTATTYPVYLSTVIYPDAGPFPTAGFVTFSLAADVGDGGSLLYFGVTGDVTYAALEPDVVGTFNVITALLDGGNPSSLVGSFTAAYCP